MSHAAAASTDSSPDATTPTTANPSVASTTVDMARRNRVRGGPAARDPTRRVVLDVLAPEAVNDGVAHPQG
jgi:hypothetical protein